MQEITVARKSDIPEGQGLLVSADGRSIALFNVEGEFFAIDNTCPHRGGSLGDGFLDGKTVTCPLHGWQFDVSCGSGVMPPNASVSSYKVEVVDDDVVVIIP